MTHPTTLPADLAEAIEHFGNQRPETQRGELVEDQCFGYSTGFSDLLRSRRIEDVEIVSGMRFGDTTFQGQKFRLVLAGHYAVRVGDLVVDWTYRQFDPDCSVPLITPYADWRADWKEAP